MDDKVQTKYKLPTENTRIQKRNSKYPDVLSIILTKDLWSRHIYIGNVRLSNIHLSNKINKEWNNEKNYKDKEVYFENFLKINIHVSNNYYQEITKKNFKDKGAYFENFCKMSKGTTNFSGKQKSWQL